MSRAARMRGSEYNDPILDAKGTTATNHAGGINGGLTNGNDIVFRAAIRPAASIGLPQRTVELPAEKQAEIRIRETPRYSQTIPYLLTSGIPSASSRMSV